MRTADYPTEWSLFLVSTLTNDAGIRDRIYGKHGTLRLGGEPKLKFNRDFKEEFRAQNDGQDEASLAVDKSHDLKRNWFDAIPGNDLLKMAVEFCRQGKTMVWDAKTEKVVGS